MLEGGAVQGTFPGERLDVSRSTAVPGHELGRA